MGLLLAGLGCASSVEENEGFNPVEAQFPGLDVREGGIVEPLPWNAGEYSAPIVVTARRESPRNLRVGARHIMWTEHPVGEPSRISVLDKATGDIQILSTEETLPWSIAFDGREIYYADPIESVLYAMAPDSRVPLKVDGPDGVALVAADSLGPVWANFDGTIWTRDAATNFVSRVASGPGVPQAITVDADRVYWVSGAGRRLLSAPRTGGVVKELAEVGGDVTSIGFVGDSISWLDPERGTVFTVPRAGGAIQELAIGLHGTVTAAFDARDVWLLAGVQGTQVMRIPADGGPVRAHVRGVGTLTELASDARFVFGIDGETGSILAYRR